MTRKQSGVTLIELMVSMMLGLALVAGISQLFIQSQKSFRLQRNVSDMIDDGSFLLEALAKSVLLAGYSADGTKVYPVATNTVFTVSGSPSVPNINFNGVNEYIYGADEVSSNGKGDQLVYRYKLSAISELTNSICTNTTTLKSAYEYGATVVVRMYKKDDGDTFVFYCKSAVFGAAISTIEDAQPLVSNVEKLEFQYGVRVKKYKADLITRDTANDTYYYTTATNVTDWTSVFAVKIFLALRSDDTNLTKNKTGWSIEGGATQYPTTDEKRIYKVFSKTIYLRPSEQ